MDTDLFRLAVRSIGKRKKRAALTMLGIFIGIAAVVALVSLGQGLQDTINAQFEKAGADKIMIQAKDPAGVGEKAPGAMTSHERDLIGRVNGVAQTAGMVFRAGKITFNNIQRVQFLIGVPTDKAELDLAYNFTTLEVEQGRKVTHKDKNKAAVGYKLANNNVFGKNLAVGDKIDLEGEVFDIVGVFKHTGDPGMDGSVLVTFDDANRLLKIGDTFNYIIAQTERGVDPEQVALRIEKDVRRNRHEKEDKQDFSVQTSTQLIASFNSVFNIIQVVFVGIAAISLLVGGIGIANVMFTAVLERTREIGVMKAIGARNRDIMTMFLIESGVLGLAGGVVGVIIGASISKTVELGANAAFGPGTIYASFSPYLIVGALLFSFILGAVSGVLPARRASKLRPVEALRYE